MMFWVYTLRAMWRLSAGRWYVWRDAPTSVVREVACLWREVRHNQDDDDLRDLVLEARQEYKRRRARGRA